MEKKHVTFNDIAAYTHFSKTTISRYFNCPESLAPESQERIRQALIDLKYQENKVARILAKGNTEMIGVIMPNLYISYFSEMLTRILTTYEEFGYKFIVFLGNSNPALERQYIQELISYQVEGLVVMSFTLPSEELRALPVPVVCIEREDQYVSSVNSDNYAGAIEACRHLESCGCDILFHINLPETPESAPSYQRIQGFRDYCGKQGIRHEVLLRSMGTDYPSIERALSQVLDYLETRYPYEKKGLFFSDDTRASIFLNLLIRRFHTLPDRYQIVGFDNSAASEGAVYPITTIGQQIDLIAREAVRLMHSLIEEVKKGTAHSAVPVTHQVISPTLVKRETTTPVD